MKRCMLLRINVFSVLWLLATVAGAQNLDKILQEHFKTIGQENLMSTRSVFMEIREIDGFGGGKRYQMTKKAPNKVRIEGKWQGQLYVNAFDGTRAWTIAPWTGVHIAQWMTDRERDLLLMNIGLGSPLYNYDGINNQLTLIGNETIQGDGHYVIRSTMPSGFFVDYLMDKKDHLIHLARIYSADDSEKVEKEVIFKNYKSLGSFTIPFGFENRIGRSGTDVIVDNIVFGQGAPSSLFKKPEN